MRFDIARDGTDYSIDITQVTPEEWRIVKNKTGIGAGGFLKGMQDIGSLEAGHVQGIWWLMQRRAGIPNPSWDDDSLPVLAFLTEMGNAAEKARKAASEAEGEEAPKAPSVPTPPTS